MTKYLSISLLTIVGVFLLISPALANTIVSFSPTSITTTQGQAFNLIVIINPQNKDNYTVKIELDYPADLLEVRAFNFANGWTPLSQPGYDLVDNNNGKLIKTAGYPGGISSYANFGTVSFYAKKSGSGTIKMGDNSLALDINNQNVISKTQAVSFSVSAPVVAAPKEPVKTMPPPTITELDDGIDETDETEISEPEEIVLSEEIDLRPISIEEPLFEDSLPFLATMAVVWGGTAQFATITAIAIFFLMALIIIAIKGQRVFWRRKK